MGKYQDRPTLRLHFVVWLTYVSIISIFLQSPFRHDSMLSDEDVEELTKEQEDNVALRAYGKKKDGDENK